MNEEQKGRIRIEVDERSGFCSGVIKAIRTAEGHLETGCRLFSLGELVHNPLEVERLRKKGLEPVSYGEFEDLENTTLMIRAHGEPPETYRRAERKNIKLIDATCPIVRNLQKEIKKCYDSAVGKEGSILIFGKQGHPEVRALVGQTEGNARVVKSEEELEKLDLKTPVHLFSQTTMNPRDFGLFQAALRGHLRRLGMDPEGDLHVYDTICRQVSSREKYLEAFVARFDLVFFVSGKQSSNGKALYSACRKINSNTHFISSPEEADEAGLEGIGSVGICGATSTPAWLLAAVRERLLDRIKDGIK
jgi:4-hydroxy-3-methylbut-2-enyl diphosphate reductase